MDCNACAKQFLCDRKQCNFKSWIYTKNYGKVKHIKEKA